MAQYEMAYSISSRMLETSLALLDAKRAMLGLLHFIRELVPFEHALCVKVDRTQKLMTTVMDYTPQASAIQLPPRRHTNILPWKTLVTAASRPNKQVGILEVTQESSVYAILKEITFYKVSTLVYCVVDMDVSKNSTYSILFLHSDQDAFSQEHADVVDFLRSALQAVAERLLEENDNEFLSFTEDGDIPTSPDGFLRQCPGLAGVMRQIDAIAPTLGTVLITGATGVGKELVAESVHALSPRWGGPFVKVNSGAIPDTLLDSELFGHEKGAFTGAVSAHPGYFEQANGGTIYLDEIGELPLQAQVRLLRVLESREVKRVGGTRRLPLDIRIIAGTNRDLWSMVEQGTFREDLWYRLHVFPVHVPSLAERPADIPILARQFLRQYVEDQGIAEPPRVDDVFIRELRSQHWRGNVRELRYAVERAVLRAVTEGAHVLRLGIEDYRQRHDAKALCCEIPSLSSEMALAAEIREALARSGGRIQGEKGAAEALGVSPSTLRSRMVRLGIPLPRQK